MTITPPRTLTRLPYFVRWLIYIVAVGLIAAAVLPIVGEDQFLVFLLVFAPIILIYRVVWLDIPRARSIPWNPWLLLLALIPGAGAILQILLFALPAKVVNVRVE